jgi:hypothetical protein
MEYPEVKRRVNVSLEYFEQEDRYLLEHNLSERCIAARIAYHLQRVFPEYSVDVEYNRAGDIPKRLDLPEECANAVDDEGRTLVVPDIIIHQRGSDGPNILGIELKKAGDRRGTDCDRKRMRALKESFGYCFSALFECETRAGREPRIFVCEWL